MVISVGLYDTYGDFVGSLQYIWMIIRMTLYGQYDEFV